MHILIHNDNSVFIAEKKQLNRSYYSQHFIEEFNNEQEMMDRIKEIDSNYIYKTEAERLEEIKNRLKYKVNENW